MSETDLHVPAGVSRGAAVVIYFEGQPVSAFAGESVATALLAAGISRIRSSPRGGAPRGLLCGIGLCQECVVVVEGRTLPSCQLPVQAGMQVFEKRYQ